MEPAQDLATAAPQQARLGRCEEPFSPLLRLETALFLLEPVSSVSSSPLGSLAQAALRDPRYWSPPCPLPHWGSPAGTRPLPTMSSTHTGPCKPTGAIALPASAPIATPLTASTYLPTYPSDPPEGGERRALSSWAISVPRIPSSPPSSQAQLHPLTSRDSGAPTPDQGPTCSSDQLDNQS